MAEEKKVPTVDKTPTEFFGTLTGFDEIGIEKEFGQGVVELLQSKRMTWLRALVFVDMKRRKTDPDPKGRVLAMTVDDVTGYFLPEGAAHDEPGEAV